MVSVSRPTAFAQPRPHPSRSSFQEAILIPPVKKAAAKKAPAKKRAAQQTEVQTDRQRSAPEKPDDQNRRSDDVETTPEFRPYTPEELAEQEHAARVAHNERTGGGTVREGELEAEREKHLRRTAGVLGED